MIFIYNWSPIFRRKMFRFSGNVTFYRCLHLVFFLLSLWACFFIFNHQVLFFLSFLKIYFWVFIFIEWYPVERELSLIAWLLHDFYNVFSIFQFISYYSFVITDFIFLIIFFLLSPRLSLKSNMFCCVLLIFVFILINRIFILANNELIFQDQSYSIRACRIL